VPVAFRGAAGNPEALECIRRSGVRPGGDRGLALSGGSDGTIDLWQLPAGTPAGRLVGHRAWVTALAVTPDGRRAVSCGYDGTVRVWDLPGRRLERSLRGHRDIGARSVAISSDGRLVASGGWDGTVRLWRMQE
jgi:WD40 repeat protein